MPEQSSESGQAGVEVTPEMIRAGVSELTAFDEEHDSGFEFVRRLYQTMAVLAPRYTDREGHQDDRQPPSSVAT